MAIALSADSDVDDILIPRTGMQLPRNLPFEKWLVIGRQLSVVGTSSSWCLGDWLIYGEDAYDGRYRDAIEQTSLDYQTLRNYAWVARRFPLSRRRDSLSFGHHAEVAVLSAPEQDFWLRKAEDLGWSRNRLRREVRASLSERSAAGDSDAAGADRTPSPDDVPGVGSEDGRNAVPPSPSADRTECQIKIQLSQAQLETCRAAAVKAGCSIEDWAALVLDHAACTNLSLRIGQPVRQSG
jgi:hypothetical protein